MATTAARERVVRAIAARKNPRTGRPYGRQRADAILRRAGRQYVGRRGPLKEAFTVPPDETAQIMGYEDADEMLRDVRHRREAMERTGQLKRA